MTWPGAHALLQFGRIGGGLAAPFESGLVGSTATALSSMARSSDSSASGIQPFCQAKPSSIGLV
jgi:hypothetical protein